MSTVYEKAFEALSANQIDQKVTLVFELKEQWLANELSFEESIDLPDVEIAGHPEKPELVAPKNLTKRRLGTPKGIAALIHAVAHIEFNAINLACDAVYRYQGMPKAYYDDWIKVVAEEAYHFSLIKERLQELGYHYGDFPAHNGLWDLAKDTRHDFRLRMALIPRVMEARGLDVTPGMRDRKSVV